MSKHTPTEYNIRIEHNPYNEDFPYTAQVFHIDATEFTSSLAVRVGKTPEEAFEAMMTFLRNIPPQEPTITKKVKISPIPQE